MAKPDNPHTAKCRNNTTIRSSFANKSLNFAPRLQPERQYNDWRMWRNWQTHQT